MTHAHQTHLAAPGASAVWIGAVLGGIVLAAVVIFALGVVVGKRVAESVPGAAAESQTLRAGPPPIPAAPPLEPRAETALQPAAPPSFATPVPAKKPNFYDRLSGSVPAVPAVPAAPPEGPPPSTTATPAEQAAPPVQTSPSASLAQTTPPAAAAPAAGRPATARPSEAKPPAVAAKADPAAQIRSLAGKGRFAVQLASVNNRAAAEETAARIKRHGLEVLTVMASINGKIWYRIRVGSFPNQQAAARAAGIFRSAYGYTAVAVQN